MHLIAFLVADLRIVDLYVGTLSVRVFFRTWKSTGRSMGVDTCGVNHAVLLFLISDE